MCACRVFASPPGARFAFSNRRKIAALPRLVDALKKGAEDRRLCPLTKPSALSSSGNNVRRAGTSAPSGRHRLSLPLRAQGRGSVRNSCAGLWPARFAAVAGEQTCGRPAAGFGVIGSCRYSWHPFELILPRLPAAPPFKRGNTLRLGASKIQVGIRRAGPPRVTCTLDIGAGRPACKEPSLQCAACGRYLCYGPLSRHRNAQARPPRRTRGASWPR